MFVPVILTILFAIGFSPWRQICFNLLIACYSLFDEMRLATVLYAIVLRIILYPFRVIDRKMTKDKDELDEKMQLVRSLPDLNERKEKESILRKNSINVFNWTFFSFWFFLLNALATGTMFLQPFTAERIKQHLFSFIPMPALPLNTIASIPLVGLVDLTKQNTSLNFISALSIAIVGLVEIIIHKRTKKRDVIMLLLVFPAAGFFLTNQVPSGFEFSIWIFEMLTVLLIFGEGALGVGKNKKSLH